MHQTSDFRQARLIQATLGLGVIACLVWSAAQPYLMVLSIFPTIAYPAGVSLFILSVILALSTLFPHQGRQAVSSRMLAWAGINGKHKVKREVE